MGLFFMPVGCERVIFDKRVRIHLPVPLPGALPHPLPVPRHGGTALEKGPLRSELISGKGMRTATFQFAESGGSVNGPNLFTELPFL